MTLPLSTVNQASRQNWLGRYMAVEKGADKELFDALVEAAKGIDKMLVSLKGVETKGAVTRRLQLALAHKEIRLQMTELFDGIGKLIKSNQSKAAEAAVDAALVDEKRLLTKIFPAKVDREAYAKSLRQSATRNIQSTMTRVLQTQQPFSKRVYKTRALSQGMVDRAVNNALARGDSFENLAKDVASLIDPNVPGGVTYAAKRLARTEINNAFHAQSISDAQQMPWVNQMLWNLSKRHMNYPGDPCEAYARRGLFPVESVPDKPHPHCRCFVTPEPVQDNVFDHMLDSGQLDNYLDDFISGGSPGPGISVA